MGHDIEQGKAFRIAGKAVCANCITPDERNNISSSAVARNKSTTRVRAVPKPGPGTSTRMPQVPNRPTPSKAPMLAAVGAGLLLLGAIAFWMMSKSTPPPVDEVVVERKAPPKPPPPQSPTPAPPPEEKKPEDPQLAAARAAIEAARATSKSDLETQRVAWEEAARKAALTPLFKEASAALAEVKEKLAATKPPDPPKPPDPSPAPTPDPPKPPPAAGVSAGLWKVAMEKATAGDFDGAAAEFRKEPAGNGEADLMSTAGAALVSSRGEISKMAAGTPVALTYRNEFGERKRVEGTIVQASSARLQIKQGEEVVFVEVDEISAASLVAICKPSQVLHRRYAALCILEGEPAAAERLVGADGFPARYWEYARDVKVPPAPQRELEARRLFYAAEREYAKPETQSSAVAKYKSIADNYADTKVAKSESARIKQRGDAGREYFFAMAAIKASGTFALAPMPRTEFAWVSKADVEGAAAAENYVEVEFAALPDAAYKAWALLGGCCQEVLACYLQTTDATELNPKTRQRGPIDPGSAMAAPIKNRITTLKKTHAEHKIKGAKEHPKLPAKWEWVEIPLPKYAAAGPKKIRILSDQQGFGVGAIVVSVSRQGPPSDADMKDDLEKLKASVPPPPESKPWRALFDGKTKESVLRGAAPGWKVEDGKLVATGVNDAAQTHEDFKNGELRIRFEAQGLERLWFNFRQGTPGAGYSISLESNLAAMDGKHELIYSAMGDKVTATLDGKPIPVAVLGAVEMGCLQFNGTGKRFAVLSIDARP